jgi:AraC-like DNA-binding protein
MKNGQSRLQLLHEAWEGSMNKALSVTHGRFGRVTLYDLSRGYVTHAHREAQIVFHIRGEAAALNVINNPIFLNRDHGVACNSWEPHDYSPPPRFSGQRSLTLYIDSDWFESYAGFSGKPLFFGRRHVEHSGPIMRGIGRLLEAMTEGAMPDKFEGLVHQLVSEVVEQTNERFDSGSGLRLGVMDFRVRKAMRLLGDNSGAPLDLACVARAAGMSRPNFYRQFREQTGMTPKLFFNMLRMERALDDLANTRKPVTEIGLDLGFATQSSFSRFFALNSGISPSDYRNVVQILN